MKFTPLFIAVMLCACGEVPLGTKDKDTRLSDTGGESGEEAIQFGGVEILPGSVDFGKVRLGSEDSATVTLTNTLSTEVMISNAYLSGSDDFTLSEDVELPLTMSGDATRVLTLTFAPSARSTANSTLYVGVAGEVGYAEIDVTGQGKEGGSSSDDTGDWTENASLSASPSSIDFGTVPVLNSSSQPLSVTNTGTTDVLITELNITNSAFSVESSFSIPALLVPGATTSIPLTFSPESEGLYEAILDINTDPEGASVYVDLDGLGSAAECSICAPVLSVSTSSGSSTGLDLTPPFLYGCTANGSVTLSNAGDQTLEITGVSIQNDSISTCGTFSRSWAGATTLEPGLTTTVAVDYITDTGCLEIPYPSWDQNVMHIYSNDPSQPDKVVELSASLLLCD